MASSAVPCIGERRISTIRRSATAGHIPCGPQLRRMHLFLLHYPLPSLPCQFLDLSFPLWISRSCRSCTAGHSLSVSHSLTLPSNYLSRSGSPNSTRASLRAIFSVARTSRVDLQIIQELHCGPLFLWPALPGWISKVSRDFTAGHLFCGPHFRGGSPKYPESSLRATFSVARTSGERPRRGAGGT